MVLFQDILSNKYSRIPEHNVAHRPHFYFIVIHRCSYNFYTVHYFDISVEPSSTIINSKSVKDWFKILDIASLTYTCRLKTGITTDTSGLIVFIQFSFSFNSASFSGGL